MQNDKAELVWSHAGDCVHFAQAGGKGIYVMRDSGATTLFFKTKNRRFDEILSFYLRKLLLTKTTSG